MQSHWASVNIFTDQFKIVMLINIMTEELIITEFNNGNLLTYQVTIENSRQIVTDHSDKISLRRGGA